MATLKHIASKNSDYSAAETYLVYQHDEFSGKKILDEQSRPKLRESYILDTLECGEASFAMACLLANRKYDKNNHPDDIKSLQRELSRSSCYRLHPPGRTQPFGKYPCPHRDRQRPDTRSGAQALYAEAP